MARKTQSKKGFTIVELVIVIAVVAVLAAVLIPTFAGIINKANLSVDQQVVAGMNMALTAEEISSGKPTTLEQVNAILTEAGYRVPISPSSKNHEFYWIVDDNRVVLVKMSGDTPETIVYPEDLAKKYQGSLPQGSEWYTLGAEELTPPAVEHQPKIKIVSHALGGYTLALDESSVEGVEWGRYEIVLRLPFYLAEYKTTSGDGFTEEMGLNPYWNQMGYYNPSQVSDVYFADFATSVSKGGNVATVPYMELFAIGRDMERFHMDENNSQPIALDVVTPDGNIVHIDSVGVAVWGTLDGGSYYNSEYHALEDMDIVNGIKGTGGSDQYLVLQNEDEVPIYIINLYDKSDNLIGTNTYLPPVSEVVDSLNEYVANYENWLSESGKDNTRETLLEYHNAGNKFTTPQLRIEEFAKSFGVGDTGSEIIQSVVLGCLEGRPSTFDRYTIVIKATEPGINENYIFEYTELQ